MKMITASTLIAGALAAAALGAAATATAAPTTNSAADVVRALQDQGYSVQFNGTTLGPLSTCTVTGVHGLTAMMGSAQPGTAYIDLSCAPTNN